MPREAGVGIEMSGMDCQIMIDYCGECYQTNNDAATYVLPNNEWFAITYCTKIDVAENSQVFHKLCANNLHIRFFALSPYTESYNLRLCALAFE